MLETVMKVLFQIFLLFLLVGCATPYYPVYVSNEGDYYIAEQQTTGPYYGSNSILFNDIGTYPWWSGSYPVELFAYYSPNYYPYYFSIWYPPGYHPFYGFYGGHYAYWCPPHRLRRHHGQGPSSGSKGSPVMPPAASVATRPGNPELWSSIDRAEVNREIMQRRSIGRRAATTSRSIPVYGRSSSALTGSSGPGRSSARSSSARSFRPVSRSTPAIHEQ
jgi:hypothetical protein